MRSIRSVRLAGILAMVIGSGLLIAWFFSFSIEQERYLIGRDFRILTTTATQLENFIRAQGSMFSNFLVPLERQDANHPRAWFDSARGYVPSFESVDVDRLPPPFSQADKKTRPKTRVESQVIIDGPRIWLNLVVHELAPSVEESQADGARTVWLTLGTL